VRRGRFITFEGGEGAGKSTQIALLATWLRRREIDPLLTREPGGAPGAEEIRRLLVTGGSERWDGVSEALLHYAARREHLLRTIEPALASGRWVLCDRFADSTMAYQGYGHGLGRRWLTRLHGLVVGDFAPDLTLVLDLPVEQGLARAGARAGNETRYEQMELGFHRRLRQGFRDIARREPKRCRLIDAAGDVPSVAEAVLKAVAQRFRLPKA